MALMLPECYVNVSAMLPDNKNSLSEAELETAGEYIVIEIFGVSLQ